MRANCPELAAGRDPQAGGPMLTIGADLTLSPVYVSKALFYLVLDCVVFSLAALIPDSMDRNV